MMLLHRLLLLGLMTSLTPLEDTDRWAQLSDSSNSLFMFHVQFKGMYNDIAKDSGPLLPQC